MVERKNNNWNSSTVKIIILGIYRSTNKLHINVFLVFIILISCSIDCHQIQFKSSIWHPEYKRSKQTKADKLKLNNHMRYLFFLSIAFIISIRIKNWGHSLIPFRIKQKINQKELLKETPTLTVQPIQLMIIIIYILKIYSTKVFTSK